MHDGNCASGRFVPGARHITCTAVNGNQHRAHSDGAGERRSICPACLADRVLLMSPRPGGVAGRELGKQRHAEPAGASQCAERDESVGSRVRLLRRH